MFKVLDGCPNCGKCYEVCAVGAISFPNGKAIIDKNICVECGFCVNACPVKVIGVVENSEPIIQDREESEV